MHAALYAESMQRCMQRCMQKARSNACSNAALMVQSIECMLSCASWHALVLSWALCLLSHARQIQSVKGSHVHHGMLSCCHRLCAF
eukprot:1142259-Pelagomonas_calceolata.AAC.1